MLGLHQQLGAIFVRHLGAVDPGLEHQTLRVYQQRPLAAADLLAAIEAPLLPAYAGCFGRLAVHDRGAGASVPAKPRPQALTQLGVQALPRPVEPPPPEPVVDSLYANDKKDGEDPPVRWELRSGSPLPRR